MPGVCPCHLGHRSRWLDAGRQQLMVASRALSFFHSLGPSEGGCPRKEGLHEPLPLEPLQMSPRHAGDQLGRECTLSGNRLPPDASLLGTRQEGPARDAGRGCLQPLHQLTLLSISWCPRRTRALGVGSVQDKRTSLGLSDGKI